MSVLVDTSVWSIARRRAERHRSRRRVSPGRPQEVLQGFPSADRTRRLVEYLAPFPILSLHRGDYVYAAEIRNKCRAKGLTISTVDAQIAAAAINHRCALLTVDRDFEGISRHFPLRFA